MSQIYTKRMGRNIYYIIYFFPKQEYKRTAAAVAATSSSSTPPNTQTFDTILDRELLFMFLYDFIAVIKCAV